MPHQIISIMDFHIDEIRREWLKDKQKVAS